MPEANETPSFRQTRSIARRFRWTILLIGVFFVLEFAGLYLSSWSTFRTLANLHEITTAADLSRQGREVLYSINETLTASATQSGPDLLGSRSVLIVASKRELDLIRQAREVVVFDEDADAMLRQSEEIILHMQSSFSSFGENPGETEKARLIGTQFALEGLESLRRVQIHLTARGEALFKEVNSTRNRPVIVGALIAIAFLSIALWFGLNASKRLSASLSSLLRATKEVTAGNMESRAEIVEPDEIGYLANAFNLMTESLKSRTVSRDYVVAIIESMKDAVVVFDQGGHIRRANLVTSSLFGYDQDELDGKIFETLFRDPPDLGSQMRNAECVAIRKNHETFPAEISITSIQLQGQRTSYVSVVKDITDRKNAELEIERRSQELAAANRELEAFSYSVSHDLRAPLRAIDGFSHALLEENGDRLDDQGKKDLSRVRAASQTMGKLIDDLLNLSRLSRAEMKKDDVDLSAIVESIAKNLRESDPSRDVEFVIQPDLHADADPSLIRIALDNLVGNAWKYTSKRPRARIEFGLAKSDGKSAFVVRDDGAGFNPEFASRLFGAFQRLHSAKEFPGTGIGLATVQRIIRRHGGSIWAEGQVEKGSAFYFTL